MGPPIKFVPGLIHSGAFELKFLAAGVAPPDSGYFVPATVDLRPQLLPSNHQGETPLCAAFAVAGWLEYLRWKYFGEVNQIDPEPIYKTAKSLDGYPQVEGTTLEAAIAAAEKLGYFKDFQYGSIRKIRATDAPQALHRYGIVLCGLNITENWTRVDNTGWLKPGGAILGGHAVLLCAYSLRHNPPWYAVQNSWGTDYGWHGFVRLTPDIFHSQFLYGAVMEIFPKPRN
jgi:hypothetical protein